MPAQTLYQCALKSLVKSLDHHLLSDIIRDTTPAMKSEIIRQLGIMIDYPKLHGFLTFSSKVLEDLFRSEWYLQADLHFIEFQLSHFHFPSIFTYFNNECSKKLGSQCTNNDAQVFLRYASIPINYSLYLVERGHYYYAKTILKDLVDTVDHFIGKTTVAQQGVYLHQMKIVAITALFHCCNTLYDITQGEKIYAMRNDLLRPINDTGYRHFKQKAAAYLAECSKFCQIKSDMTTSHELISQAMRLLHQEEELHPKIIIDTLCQSMWCNINLCHFEKAKLCIEAAVKLASSFGRKSSSILYFDCLLNYGGFLHSTDQLHDGVIVMTDAYRVSRLE